MHIMLDRPDRNYPGNTPSGLGKAGAVRSDLTAAELLVLTNATALASTGPPHAVRLMYILRGGIETRADTRP